LQFEVRAVDAEGQLSPRPAGIHLFVQVPLWLRWWFLAGMAGLIAAATTGLFQYRVRQLVAMERLRTRIATDLHDDMGASLSQISILSELARKGSTAQVLTDIAEIARGMAGEMSDIVWAINPRHDRFDVLVHRMRRFAEDTLGGKSIELDFATSLLVEDSTVPLEIRRPLYLIFKEAVNNVARHSGGTRVSIHLDQDRVSLKLTVEDNGHGFDSNKLYEGEGLASISRRTRDIGGTADWTSREDAGTRFTAILPLRARGYLHELGGRFRGNRR
jgi:signal transduction histidine kinase